MELIYHYTTIDALYGMFSNSTDNITLWATNSLCLNDPQERKYGELLIFHLIEKVEDLINIDSENKISNFINDSEFQTSYEKFTLETDVNKAISDAPYIISFSSLSDSLPMWNMYGANGNGIAIGFDRDMLRDAVLLKIAEIVDIDYNPNESLVIEKLKTIYDGMLKVQKDGHFVIKQTGRSVAMSVLITLVNSIGLSFKSEAYSFEKEVRIIIDSSFSNSNVKYRTSKGFIIPYIEIELPKDCVREMVFGPTHNFERSIFSVKKFISSKKIDLEQIDFRKSMIDYR